jgi:hypothetical protein
MLIQALGELYSALRSVSFIFSDIRRIIWWEPRTQLTLGLQAASRPHLAPPITVDDYGTLHTRHRYCRHP